MSGFYKFLKVPVERFSINSILFLITSVILLTRIVLITDSWAEMGNEDFSHENFKVRKNHYRVVYKRETKLRVKSVFLS